MKKSKDVLFISSSFFGYAAEIVRVLESHGRQVLWVEDRPATDTKTKIAARLAPWLLQAKSERYFDSVIEQARSHPIRDVFIIKGESLSPAAIQRMRTAFPQARFTLYFWDSYRNMPANSPDKVGCVDRAFSFDPIDVKADPRLEYRPLFFLDEYASLPPAAGGDLDLLFIGTVHTDRYAVIRRIARALPAGLRFETRLYFPSQWIYRARRLFDPAFWQSQRAEFIFKPLGKAQVMALIARARAVVDIERPVQAGYTMRTLEMLGAGRKLITTNPRVTEADFYDPQNIVVINRKKPVIPADFFTTPYRPVAAELLARYSLTGWLKELGLLASAR